MMEEKILKTFKNKDCLVTGGTGMIGRQVVGILCNAGANVVSVSLDNLKLNPEATYLKGDLSNFDFCKAITRKKDFVFHLSGIKGSIKVTKEKPASFFVPLLQMNTNLLEACKINKVEKMVYTSSIGAYSPREIFKESEDSFESGPMDFYPGWAKRIGELQIKAYQEEFGLNYSVVRLSNVFGMGDNFDPENAMVIPSLMARILKGENPLIVWGDGSNVRDFLFSADAAKGIVLAMYYGTDNSFVNLGGGIAYSIKQLIETLRSFIIFDYQFDISKPRGFPKRVMDISLASETIHFIPETSLLEGLKETWQWYKNNQSEYLKRKNYF